MLLCASGQEKEGASQHTGYLVPATKRSRYARLCLVCLSKTGHTHTHTSPQSHTPLVSVCSHTGVQIMWMSFEHILIRQSSLIKLISRIILGFSLVFVFGSLQKWPLKMTRRQSYQCHTSVTHCLICVCVEYLTDMKKTHSMTRVFPSVSCSPFLCVSEIRSSHIKWKYSNKHGARECILCMSNNSHS